MLKGGLSLGDRFAWPFEGRPVWPVTTPAARIALSHCAEVLRRLQLGLAEGDCMCKWCRGAVVLLVLWMPIFRGLGARSHTPLLS